MDATSAATVVGQLSVAGGSLVGHIPLAAAIGIGVGLLGFGIRYLVHTFKSTAH